VSYSLFFSILSRLIRRHLLDTHVLPPDIDKIFRRVQDSAHYMPDWQMEVRFLYLPANLPLALNASFSASVDQFFWFLLVGALRELR